MINAQHRIVSCQEPSAVISLEDNWTDIFKFLKTPSESKSLNLLTSFKPTTKGSSDSNIRYSLLTFGKLLTLYVDIITNEISFDKLRLKYYNIIITLKKQFIIHYAFKCYRCYKDLKQHCIHRILIKDNMVYHSLSIQICSPYYMSIL